MEIALTGITGHLGSAVVRELLRRQHSVRALVRSIGNKSYADLPVRECKGDLLDAASLPQFLEGADALIHCAAVISINGDPGGIVSSTNVTGTQNVLKAAAASGVRRVIHVSSIHAYQQLPQDVLLDESRATVDADAFAYDRSKLKGQQIALSMNRNGMEVLVMNPTSIIGPYDFKPSKAGKGILELIQGKQPFMLRGGFDFCDVRDVASAMVSGLTMGRGGETYLLSGKWHSLVEMTSILSEIRGKHIRVMVLPSALAGASLPLLKAVSLVSGREPVFTPEALHAVTYGNKNISSAKAETALNFQSRPLQETLFDTVEWFRQVGYL